MKIQDYDSFNWTQKTDILKSQIRDVMNIADDLGLQYSHKWKSNERPTIPEIRLVPNGSDYDRILLGYVEICERLNQMGLYKGSKITTFYRTPSGGGDVHDNDASSGGSKVYENIDVEGDKWLETLEDANRIGDVSRIIIYLNI